MKKKREMLKMAMKKKCEVGGREYNNNNNNKMNEKIILSFMVMDNLVM